MKAFNLLLGTACMASIALAQAAETLTVATVNNADMIRMQRLSKTFEQQNPDIKLNWVVLEENVLRQRLTTDIATQGGQFDVLTIGMYEASLWGDKGWLAPMKDLPEGYELDDVFPSVREGLSVDGTLYALPFYAESSMTYYRTDLFEQAGLDMPEHPTWTQMARFAEKLHKPGDDQYGICLRGKAGWGENMALVTTVANAFGARWFDEKWQPEFDGPEWTKAANFYVDLLSKYGPPGASSNGFNENLALFNSGKCAMWVVGNPDQLATKGRRQAVHRLGNLQGLHQARCRNRWRHQRATGYARIDLQRRVHGRSAVRQDHPGVVEAG